MPEVTLGEAPVVHNNYTVAAIRSKLAQYAPVTVTADISGLTDTEKNVLIFIIEAAKLMDPIFNRQVFRFYDETRAQLRARRYITYKYFFYQKYFLCFFLFFMFFSNPVARASWQRPSWSCST